MNVCLVARRLWTHGVGGLEAHAQLLGQELARQGHQVHVVTTSHPDGRTEDAEDGMLIHYLAVTPPGDYSRAWYAASARWGREHFAELAIDAVVSVSTAAAGMLDMPGGPPVFMIITGYGWRQLKSFWHDSRGWSRLVNFPRAAVWLIAGMPRAARALRRSTGVLAVSHELTRQLKRYRTYFVPNLVDTSRFRPDAELRKSARAALGIGEDEVVALMVGTVNWQKGVDMGLAACARAGRAGVPVHALVVGDGVALGPLRRWAVTRAPGLRVTFAGARPPAALPPYYAVADVFLFPSRRQEGMPTVVIEAMATALPVVATRSGGTPTAVRDGQTGLLVSIDDLRGFTEALLALAQDPGQRIRLGRTSRRMVEEVFDRSVVTRRIVDIVREARA